MSLISDPWTFNSSINLCSTRHNLLIFRVAHNASRLSLVHKSNFTLTLFQSYSLAFHFCHEVCISSVSLIPSMEHLVYIHKVVCMPVLARL